MKISMHGMMMMITSDAINKFLMEQRLRGNTEKTVRGYKGFLNRFDGYMVKQGVTDLSDISIDRINEYQLYINEKKAERGHNEKLTKKSVQTYMRHVKVFMAYCYEQGYLSEEISKKIRIPKAETNIIRIIMDNEVDMIIASFKKCVPWLELRNTAITYLLLDCGLRLGEVARIMYDDINFDKGYIFVKGKGRKERVVPMGEKLRKALELYIDKRITADTPKGDKYLFLSARYKPITEYTMYDLMKRIKADTGIKRIHAHLFRHTFATNFLIYGLGDVYELSRLLGHGDIKITEQYLQLASYYTIMLRRQRVTYLDSVKK
jgi:integrase/recombinase XerC/integrase/recombinase XerD